MSKLEEFMAKHGRELKPAKEQKDSKKLTAKEQKDSKKLTAKERNELIDIMLKDFGYIL